jgi:hypothetical protein
MPAITVVSPVAPLVAEIDMGDTATVRDVFG